MGKYLSRPAAQMPEPSLNEFVTVGDWGTLFPALVEFLTLSVWEDGTPRALGTLTLFVQDGLWKVCLNDKDASRIAFVSGKTPDDALGSAEANLASAALDWRAVGKPGVGKKKI